MSKSEFKVPVKASDDATFTPPINLPEHLDQLAQLSAELRHTMTPVLQKILELTDKTALRSAALPTNS